MPTVDTVATSVPRHRVPRDDLGRLATEFLGDGAALAAFRRIAENARIDGRNFTRPWSWYLGERGHAERNRAYVEDGLALAEDAAAKALKQAGLDVQDVDAIVFVSTTGLATPSLDARLVNRMGFREDVMRLPVWGLGCAGGVAGLNRAADLARADPERRVLVVCLEICSLAFDRARLREAPPEEVKKGLVAMAIFSDGCAAAVVSGDHAGGDGPRHVAGASHLFPDTERVMGWDVTDRNLEVVLSPDIPRIVTGHVGALTARFLEAHAGGRRPRHWIMHPGGARVLDAYAKALGLDGRDLAPAVDVLREHGNMSSPTVLFALERALASGAPVRDAEAVVAALGPGFASEMALLRG